MFDFFRKKTAKDFINDAKETYGLPEAKQIPSMPKVEPLPEPEKPATTYYRLGLTDNNRVSFQMGYSEITMNSQGIDTMIDLLRSFQSKIKEVEEETDEQ